MIKLEHTDVYGFESAIRGARNPMNSWDRSDSGYNTRCFGCGAVIDYEVGENDLKLMKNLSKAGSDHGKFLRMINVTVDITAPLYWWKEFDTYKVGTVANSCSTMHKIHSKPIEWSDFSVENIVVTDFGDEHPLTMSDLFGEVVDWCEYLRKKYLDTKDKKYWRALIQTLPESYNQKRTVQLNYQVLKSMYFARKAHKLTEWHDFCDWCESLPYFKEIVIQE